jgi:hypothetical protein
MMNKNTFAQIAQRIAKPERGFRQSHLIHPAREWSIGLVVATLLFVVSAVWSAHLYMTYRDISVQEADPFAEEVVVYRESLVEGALLKFTERAERHNEFINKAVPEMEENEEVTAATTTETVVESEVSTSSDDTILEI